MLKEEEIEINESAEQVNDIVVDKSIRESAGSSAHSQR